MTDFILVQTTVPGRDDGEKIAKTLVEERLAACVTISAQSLSIYRWEGTLHRDPEHILIIKTRRALFEILENRLKEIHPYTVPEIIAWPISLGSSAYLDWIKKETETPAP